MIQKNVKELEELIELLRHKKTEEELKNDDQAYNKFYTDHFKGDLDVMINGMLRSMAISEVKFTEFWKGVVYALVTVQEDFERRDKLLSQPKQDKEGGKDFEEINN